jgi:hypothetical protein
MPRKGAILRALISRYTEIRSPIAGKASSLAAGREIVPRVSISP